ncbi:MAG: helix-turn-helix domain-containing protein [Planctomycetales bacterium]|nr:helix-turn-helix domain-containing protein [Planctomycetales bacterium]MCA9166831.1 helix-turn-helix domain-containing protein [Planctomycetales bacterium]
MAKLIELHEAAEMLGITPEELTDMRSRNEIFGYRDGSTWKFKADELERVKATLGPNKSSGSDDLADSFNLDDDLLDTSDLKLDDDDISLDLDDDVLEFSSGDDSDSILVSEEELGKSDENTASTIIGEADDLILDGGEDSDALAGVSDIELSMDKSDVLSASDVLNTLEDKQPSASDTANISLNALSSSDDDLKLQSDSGSLALSLDDLGSAAGSRIELADDDARASSSGFGSAIDLGLDDDELVLGSGTGSDVTSAGDSGISLTNPSDSGLSLEEPLELSAGSGIDALELGEDDMLELDDAMSLETEQGDDDFMLTPVEDAADEESDSGSQVIALDSEEFDDSAADMLTEDGPAFEAEGGFDGEAFTADEDDLGAPAGFAAASATGGVATAAMADESEGTYTIANVLGLFMIVALLGFTGVLMVDLINNIWSWGGTYPFNSTIMDAILGMMPGA